MLKQALDIIDKKMAYIRNNTYSARGEDTVRVKLSDLRAVIIALAEPEAIHVKSLADAVGVGYCYHKAPLTRDGKCTICQLPVIADSKSLEQMDKIDAMSTWYQHGYRDGKTREMKIKDLLEVAWSKSFIAGNAMEGFVIFQNAIRKILFSKDEKGDNP